MIEILVIKDGFVDPIVEYNCEEGIVPRTGEFIIIKDETFKVISVNYCINADVSYPYLDKVEIYVDPE